MLFTSENVAVFIAVLDHGSFSAAARALGRVPSAVSMAIADFEAALDFTLFERTSRKAIPTDAARALEPEARQLAGQLRRLDAHALALHRGLERRLTLAIAPELLSADWSRPLTALTSEFPSLDIDVLSVPQDDALRMLHDPHDAVDLALVYERVGVDDREAFHEFESERLIAVVAPHHPIMTVHGGAISQAQLREFGQVVVAARGAKSIDPRVALARRLWRTDSFLGSLAIVKAGLAWAFLPQRLIGAELTLGTLRMLEFTNMSNEVRLWIDVVWSQDRPLGVGAQRFVQLIRQGDKPTGG